jgi:hypothetical protein
MIYICILYLKSLETYLETLHSHFQHNCYFKMFKNSGSEPEFLNIYWRLKSRLFKESGLFRGQSVQQGSQWLQFFVCCILKTFLC